jgi:hypothetical protein
MCDSAIEQPYETVVREIAALLSSIGDEHVLSVRCRRLFVEYPNKLCRVVLKPALAESAMESEIRLEPSEFLLKLVAAIRANDIDKIRIVEHEIRS